VKSEHIQVMLRKLGCTKIKPGGQWIYSSCPLAPWTHAKLVDNHPSFSVAISEGNSGCTCHACNFKGSLVELLWKIQIRSGEDQSDVMEFVSTHNGMTVEQMTERLEAQGKRLQNPEQVSARPVFDPQKEVAGIKGVQLSFGMEMAEKDLRILPEETLTEKFLPIEHRSSTGVRNYLVNERRFSLEVLNKWEVCWDAKFGRITIPIRDCKGRLVGHSGRAFREGVTPKYMHAKGFKRDYYLYGEQFFTENGTGVGCLTEGFFDVMRLQSYGYATGAVMGTHLSDFQLEKLVRFFNRVVIVPDGDKPGREAAEAWCEKISKRLPCKIVSMRDGDDPDDLTPTEASELIGPPGVPP